MSLFDTLNHNRTKQTKIKRDIEKDCKIVDEWFENLADRIVTKPEQFPQVYQRIKEYAEQSAKLDHCVLQFSEDKESDDHKILPLSLKRMLHITKPSLEYGSDYIRRVDVYPFEHERSVVQLDTALEGGTFVFHHHSNRIAIHFVYDPDSCWIRCTHSRCTIL